MGVRDDVADGAEVAGDAVEALVNRVADPAADVVETAGNLVQDALRAGGDVLGTIPAVGSFLRGTAYWAGGVVAGAVHLVVAIFLKGPAAVIGGAAGGLIKAIGGFITFQADLIREGLLDVLAGFMGAIIAVFGTFVSLIERLVPFFNKERTLTREERAVLEVVFQKTIALYNIRVRYTSKIEQGIRLSPFTLGNTIYSTDPQLLQPSTAWSLQLLVHECVHVWQYQNLGYRYVAEALGAQILYTRDKPGNAYEWTAELKRGRTNWEDFNRESQASLIEDIWREGLLRTRDVGISVWSEENGKGAFYKKQQREEDPHCQCVEIFQYQEVDHTPLAIASVRKMRSARNVRLSQYL